MKLCNTCEKDEARYCKKCVMKVANKKSFKTTIKQTEIEEETSINIASFFNGRISRSDYWVGLIASFVIFLITIAFFEDSDFIIGLILMFFIFYKTSFMVRRAHDLNHSGWFILLAIIPLLNIYLLFKLLFISGNNKTNKYGSPLVGEQPMNEIIKKLFLPNA